MIVIVQKSGYGYTAVPLSLRQHIRFAKAMERMTGHRDARVLWAEQYELPEEIKTHRLYRRMLERGWPIYIRVSEEIYAHWLGLDADSPY